MRAAIITLVIAGIVIGSLAGAGEGAKPARELGEQWKSLSPEERAALKERYETFRRLPPEQQERLRRRYRKFKGMIPEQRRAMRERWQLYRSLPGEQRDQMMKSHRRWRRIPPEQRRMIRKRMQTRFQQMPDPRLAEFFRNLGIWRTLPREEREKAFRRFIEIRKHHRAGFGKGRSSR